MPKYSRFYSATEAEALANVIRLFPKQTARAPLFGNDDAKQLSDILSGTITNLPHSRADVNQPIFRRSQHLEPIEHLLDVSGFSVSRDTVHRRRDVRYTSSSEDSTEWQTRSRTPSSDDPTPLKSVPSPPSSVKVETSSNSGDSLDDNLPHATGPTMQNRECNSELFTDYFDTRPADVLQNMDTQFSKWSYDLNEGITAIPFVMAQAPAETHTRLVEIDRRFWAAGDGQVFDDTARTDAAAAAVLNRFQKTGSGRPTTSRRTAQIRDGILDNRHDKAMSKRAALIAKSKAAKDSSLVVSNSANQRRSAMHKNKNRRSIMPSPPPTARRLRPESTTEPLTEQRRPTIFILNKPEDDERREVDSALQDRRIDPDNRQHLEELMNKLNKAITEKGEGSDSRIVALDEETPEQAGKAHRLKGKARKKARN